MGALGSRLCALHGWLPQELDCPACNDFEATHLEKYWAGTQGPGASIKAIKGTSRGMILPFDPMALTFHKISYYVPFPKVLDLLPFLLPHYVAEGTLCQLSTVPTFFGSLRHVRRCCIHHNAILIRRHLLHCHALLCQSFGCSLLEPCTPYALLRLPMNKGSCDAQEMADKKKESGSDMLQLLNEVSGAFQPGILTALVGVSGAGKTTLMDVLAGRKTGACCRLRPG